jgi:hypothetical protein
MEEWKGRQDGKAGMLSGRQPKEKTVKLTQIKLWPAALESLPDCNHILSTFVHIIPATLCPHHNHRRLKGVHAYL